MSSLHIWFRPCVYELENRSEYHGTDYIPNMICAYYVSFSIQKKTQGNLLRGNVIWSGAARSVVQMT